MGFNSWEMHIFEFSNFSIPMTFPHALEYIYTHLRWNYHHHCGLVVKALAVDCEVLSSIPWRAELQGLITPVKRAQSGASLDSGVATHWNQAWASRVWAYKQSLKSWEWWLREKKPKFCWFPHMPATESWAGFLFLFVHVEFQNVLLNGSMLILEWRGW